MRKERGEERNGSTGNNMSHSFTRIPDNSSHVASEGRSPLPITMAAGEGTVVRGLRARKQSHLRVIGTALAVWSLSAAVILALYGVLVYYDRVPVMSKTGKRQFNTIVTGLSIALGLAIAFGLEKMFSELQWWILSRRYRARRKVETILRSEDIGHIVMLGIRSRRPTTKFAALMVVVLSLGSQIAVALIGLCYSTDAAEKVALLTDRGKVAVANMSAIETIHVVKSNSTSQLAQQYTANTYGTWSLAYGIGLPSDIPKAGSIWDPKDAWYFCPDNCTVVPYCQYIFHETRAGLAENEDENAVYVSTDRQVNASATCAAWKVVAGGDGAGTQITISTETGNSTIPIPAREGVDQTTFITDTTLSCGVGCSIVSAFEASNSDPWFYTCNVSVSSTIGGTLPEHEVGQDLRTMASGAIALKGYDMSSLVTDTNIQYQVYPAESGIGVPANGSTCDMALKIARFSIGVVAVAASNNGVLEVDGTVPRKGTLVNIAHWEYLHLIFLITAGTQLVLGVAAAWLSNTVVVPRKNALDISRVMRPMLDETSRTGTDRWIYRNILVSSDGLYDVYMEEERVGPLGDPETIEMDQKKPTSMTSSG